MECADGVKLRRGGSDNKGGRAYFPRMPHIRMHLIAWASLGLLACKSTPPKPPEPSEHALAGLAAQHVAVLPTYAVRLAGTSGPLDMKPVEFERTLDADIPAAFEDKGIKKAWLFPPDLRASYRRNSSYAADPDNFALEPLRSPMLAIETRLPEPLASQVRTLVALHDDTRLVLVPVELKLEPVPGASAAPAGQGTARGVLRVVLLDARLSNVRWIGDITSDPAPVFGAAITASVAAKLAAAVAPQ